MGMPVSATSFKAVVRVALADDAVEPYAYQQRLADEGLPELLCVPTGCGKTVAAVLPWLYRRRFHPDAAVNVETPRWLVVVLPMRSLVEQTRDAMEKWLTRLGLIDKVGLHVLMGGEPSSDQDWRTEPNRDAVFVGTQDMILSRLLLRGYGEPRSAWPVSFGLLHAGAQFVFDEVQLMGPGLGTSLQLHGLRAALGTAMPARSMWMSATVDRSALRTADYPGPHPEQVMELDPSEQQDGRLGLLLRATKTVTRGAVDPDPKRYAVSLAELVLAEHHAATRTIVVLNTVERAAAVYDEVVKRWGEGHEQHVVLTHSRFRPDDRKRQLDEALAAPAHEGTVVITTQVLEAGVDITSRTLVTELAPWSSIVQRAGRCNRRGEYPAGGRLVWVSPPRVRGNVAAAPYLADDLAATQQALSRLESTVVTAGDLQNEAVAQARRVHPVPRRRDLLDLFDTAPDLSGNDVDVGRWIREDDVPSAAVAWRTLDDVDVDMPAPTRDELCPVTVSELRDFLAARSKDKPPITAQIYDQVDGMWAQARRADIRPGVVVVVDARAGGYLPRRGWSPASRTPVTPVPTPAGTTGERAGLGDDGRSEGTQDWVSLTKHLDDVASEVRALLAETDGLPGLTADQLEAAVRAAALHDLGKAHPVFDASLRKAAPDHEPPGAGPWAKSPSSVKLRHERPYFRHELVSALMLLDPNSGLLNDASEPDLVAYLVAAHHGKVRMTARPAPGEEDDTILGVRVGDETLPLTLADGTPLPPLRLDTTWLVAGQPADDGEAAWPGWRERTCMLRDRNDLGPFRLAFLEALVRVADWRVSESYRTKSEKPETTS